jgi:plasmid stability protein
MADVKIRGLNDHLVAFYKQRAANRGVSLEEELRETLASVREAQMRALVSHLEALHAEQIRKYGILPDSTPGIRAERDGEPDA